MTLVKLPLREIKASIQEAATLGRQRGYAEGYAKATEFVRMASSLNGSTHAVLKALQGEQDGEYGSRSDLFKRDNGGPTAGTVDDSQAGDSGEGRHLGEDSTGLGESVEGASQDPDVILLAALDALLEAKTHHPETDGGPVYDYLLGLLDEPEDDVERKAFDDSKHPRGDDGRFIGREAIHAAKSDPKLAQKLRDKTTDPEQRKKLDAALEGETNLGRTKAGEHRERVAKQRQDRAERVKRALTLGDEISTARRGGEPVPASHYRELAEHLPAMTVAELRSVRGKLAASFGGDRRKAEMVDRLLAHAKNKANLLETNEKYDDLDPLDFGSLDEYQSTGNAKGNEERNPLPEAEHGGRMAQRHQLMANLPESSKTSHGTPDTGSILKQPDKMLGAETLAAGNDTGMTLADQTKHLPIDKSAAKKYVETGQAAAFRIHNAKYPLPKKSKSTWSGDDSETMPGVSGYATMGGALSDMLFNQTESATGDNYTQQAIGGEGDKPSIVVLQGKEIDGPGAETIVPNPKIAAVYTMGQVEHLASELAKSRGATGETWKELSHSIGWEDRDDFNNALADKLRQSDPAAIPEATPRKSKPATQTAAEDAEPWQLPQKQYAEEYNAGENFVNHRRVIEAALAAGKPVPPEVLADYPDLEPAASAHATAPTGAAAPPAPPADAATAHAAADEYAKEAKRIANSLGGNPDAAMAYGEAARTSREVARAHEAIDAEKARQAEPTKRVDAANAKVRQAESAVEAARIKTQAATQRAAELRAGGDPAANIAKLREQLAASKNKTAVASQSHIDENVRDKADRVAVAKKLKDTGKLSASEADAFVGGDTPLTAGNFKWKVERAGEALGLTPEQVAHALANTKPSGEMKKPGMKKTATYRGSDFLRTLGMVDEPGTAETSISDTQSRESDVAKLRKDVVGTQPMNQPRAKHGEVGPNGEVYPGGAFIATTELPKRLKDKLQQSSKGKVRVGMNGFAVPEPGQMSIVDKLGGTVMNPRNGDVNYNYLAYQKYTTEEVKRFEQLAQMHKEGKEWVSVNDYPELANLTDAARLHISGQPIPGVILDKLPGEFRDRLTKYQSANTQAKAISSDAEWFGLMTEIGVVPVPQG